MFDPLILIRAFLLGIVESERNDPVASNPHALER